MTLTGETRERLLVCTAALGRRRARQESSEMRKKFRSRFSVRFLTFPVHIVHDAPWVRPRT